MKAQGQNNFVSCADKGQNLSVRDKAVFGDQHKEHGNNFTFPQNQYDQDGISMSCQEL